MTAAPIPALAHDHDSPTGRGGMISAHAPVVRRTQNAVSVGPSRGLPPSVRPRRSPLTCPTKPNTPADYRAPQNALTSKPQSPTPLAVAISAPRGFLPRRLSKTPTLPALASASVPGRRPKPSYEGPEVNHFVDLGELRFVRLGALPANLVSVRIL